MLLDKINGLVAAGNIEEARSIIVSRLDGDRSKDPMEVASAWRGFSAFIFDNDNSAVNFEKNDHWTHSYWSIMRVELSNNFSKEKLGHVIEVMIFLRNQDEPSFTASAPSIQKTTTAKSVSDNTKSNKRPSVASLKKCTGAGTAAGALAGWAYSSIQSPAVVKTGQAVTAVAVKKSIIPTVLAGGAIGLIIGAVSFYMLKKMKHDSQ
ncbi:hypothetical protein [Maridesulfovibrio sp.]|uniref:hypothetical protein n=1 Tax=Maridesulfovibrio sp. TaxID=2795000 RepID=UPI0029CA2AD2|nr:hypothetical protein [Maridesulfovibrio sp.]